MQVLWSGNQECANSHSDDDAYSHAYEIKGDDLFEWGMHHFVPGAFFWVCFHGAPMYQLYIEMRKLNSLPFQNTKKRNQQNNPRDKSDDQNLCFGKIMNDSLWNHQVLLQFR